MLAGSIYTSFGIREGMHLHLAREIVVQTAPTGVALVLFPSACLQSKGEHSSFDELQALVRDIRPRRLIPTVNSEPWAEKSHMMWAISGNGVQCVSRIVLKKIKSGRKLGTVGSLGELAQCGAIYKAHISKGPGATGNTRE